MAETKRVSDQYNIIAPIINIGNSSSSVTIDGNLTVTGSTTSVETTNSEISDNVIVLNNGETGAGISLSTSGIEIDRGTETNVSIVYDDSVDAFRVLEGTSLTNIRVASPVDNSDAATKQYVDTAVDTANSAGSVSAAGVQGSVQYNNSNIISGDSVLLWDGTNLTVGNTSIASNSITVDDSNGDLELSGNGVGTVYARSVIKMENEVSDPMGIAGNNQLYAKSPGTGESGLYYSNTESTDELISKSKAIFYGFIF